VAHMLKIVTLAVAELSLLLSATSGFAAEQGGKSEGSESSLIFYAINFALFLFIVVKYAGPSVRGYFRSRAQSVRSTFESAEQALAKAQQQAASVNSLFARLESEKRRIIAQIRAESERQVAEIRERARKLANQIRHEGELSVKALAAEAEHKLKLFLVHSATEMARQLLQEHLTPADQHRLVESFIQQVQAENAR